MSNHIGSITLNTHLGFSIPYPVFKCTKKQTNSGFLVVQDKPICSVEFENGIEKNESKMSAQYALDSFNKNFGKYNSLMHEAENQIHEFSFDLLRNANVEVYNIFGNTHFYIESKEGCEKPFRFNIWSLAMVKRIFDDCIFDPKKPISFEEFLFEN
ncbi:hypothetical protein [Vibrio sp. D431a]|uniref:hypothetical protein n=1 Tax=Vibrio sp. D431a TaxID=2837388 RepID=UPI002554700B|nr:hypothetical protein [Vibrio sp. D431a]MDK9789751.1 hypothetical protein [Vibrio sp. D431a]